jgi:hypothetical protein
VRPSRKGRRRSRTTDPPITVLGESEGKSVAPIKLHSIGCQWFVHGTRAHIFQLSMAALLPMTIVVIATADWQEPWHGVRPLVTSATATVLAFAGLYHLEHLR